MFKVEEEIFKTLITNFTNEDNQVIIRKNDGTMHPYDFLSYWLNIYCPSCMAVHQTEGIEVDTELGKGEYYLIIAVFESSTNPDKVAIFEVPIYELEGSV